MTSRTITKETQTFQIPDVFMQKLTDYVDKMQRRAAKLNLEPIHIVVLDTETRTVNGMIFDVHEVAIVGDIIKLNGWSFVAAIDHGHTKDGENMNVIRSIPDVHVPLSFRTVAKSCDHCNTKRDRKNTYIVHNAETNEWKQVGRTCLRDYVGHKDAQRVAGYLEALIDFFEYLLDDDFSIEEALVKLFEYHGKYSGGAMNVDPRFELSTYLNFVYRSIRAFGWKSRTKAREENNGGGATASVAWNAMLDAMDSRTRRDLIDELKNPHPDEKEEVRNAIEWAQNLSHDEIVGSDYLSKLNAIALQEEVTWKTDGLAASIIAAYKRTISEKQDRAARPVSEHFGEIKKRYDFENLTAVFEHAFDGQYGTTYIYKFEDSNGNIFVWFTGNINIEVDRIYSGKATIKKHDEYREVKQTLITRAKFVEVGRVEEVQVEEAAQQEEEPLPF